jgi:hypothetical protein
MSRSRVVLFISMSVVVLGVVAGLGALWMDSARAAVGPLPGEGLVLPADTRFVIGFDVKRLVASPFWARYGKQRSMRPASLSQLEEKTGLDPARDVDQIVVAGNATPQNHVAPLVLATGRFDTEKIAKTLEGTEKATSRDVGGVTLYELASVSAGSGKSQAFALAVLDRHTLLFGPPDRVEATLGSRAKGETPLRQNAALLGLVENVRPGSTFWMVGDETLLSGMPKTIPGAAMGSSGDAGATLNLPTLKSLTVTGDLDPDLSLAVVGQAIDAPAATKLADVVRGLVALVSLQAQQKPELQQLASAISVTTDQSRVLVNARLPYDLLDALQAKAKHPAPGVAADDDAKTDTKKPE